MLAIGRIYSPQTQLPFQYEDIIKCKSDNKVTTVPLEDNLGELLSGDVLFQSQYEIKLLENQYCQLLCEYGVDAYRQNFLSFLISNSYKSTW